MYYNRWQPINNLQASGQDGDVDRFALPPCTTNQKDNHQFKNKKQPELLENLTVWKSDNQGVKEEIFIQTGRRGRDGQLGWRGLTARQWLADGAVPHSSADKPGGTTGERDKPRNPGLQRGEIKPQTSD